MNFLSDQEFESCAEKTYKTSNRFAYFDVTCDSVNKIAEMKHLNFVPAVDHWCLYCNNKFAHMRCGQCKFVYFCNEECQRKAWSVHKKHCGRDLFCICANCGKENIPLSCADCPVKYCSDECMKIHQPLHKKCSDCKIFSVLK